MQSFGKTMDIGDSRITVRGCSSFEEAERECYTLALKGGWLPKPLRRHWWQLWRPAEYDKPLQDALNDIVEYTP